MPMTIKVNGKALFPMLFLRQPGSACEKCP